MIFNCLWFIIWSQLQSKLTIDYIIWFLYLWNENLIYFIPNLVTNDIYYHCMKSNWILMKIYLFNETYNLSRLIVVFLTISSYALTDHWWCLKVEYLNVYMVFFFFAINRWNICKMITNVVISLSFDNCLENPPKGLDSREKGDWSNNQVY